MLQLLVLALVAAGMALAGCGGTAGDDGNASDDENASITARLPAVTLAEKLATRDERWFRCVVGRGCARSPGDSPALRTEEIAVARVLRCGVDFNVPSKLMNFMACGLPVVAAVRPDSEVARIVHASEGGWVTESEDLREFAALVAAALRNPRDRHRRGQAALRFAREQFSPDRLGSQFEQVLRSVVAREPVGELDSL